MGIIVHTIVILQNPHTRPLEIVELAAIHRFEEDPKCKEHNGYREGYQQIK
jgi:hypothetical protein